MPTPATKNELNRIRGMSTELKNTEMFWNRATPGVALPLMMSAEKLVAPSAIQRNGKTETIEATISNA